MARRRRRRIGDSQEHLEGADDLGDEEDEDLDQLVDKMTSIEAEVREISLSAAVQAKDTQSMRARMEQFARELKELSEEEGGDELVEDFEKLERHVASVSGVQNQLAQQFSELAGRLEAGHFFAGLEAQMNSHIESAYTRVDELRMEAAQALDQLMARVGEELDNRFGAYDDRLGQLLGDLQNRQQELGAKLAEGRVAPGQLEELSGQAQARVDALARQVEQRLDQVGADFNGRFEEMHAAVAHEFEELTERLGQELNQVARAADVEERLQGLTSDLEVAITEIRSQVEAAAGAEALGKIQQEMAQRQDGTVREIKALQGAIESLKSSVGDSEGLAERARASVEKVAALEARLVKSEERFNSIAARVEEAAGKAEKHLDTLNLAIKLVNQLEEKIRGTTALAEGAGAAPPALAEEPPRDEADLGFELADLLQVMIKHNASDLHLKVGAPPMVRLDGELIPVGERVLGDADCRRLVFSALNPSQRLQLQDKKHLDVAYLLTGARFRVNAYQERGNISAAFRALPHETRSLDDLGLPPVVKKLATVSSGLVLVTGPTGSGRSTTLTAMVDYINSNRKLHIVTIEDTIEFYHQDRLSVVTQREVGVDTPGFAEALEQAMRQDPDVIVVGDLKEAESVRRAVIAASTGHLVLAGMSSFSAVTAVNRILDVFAAGEGQRQVRQMLALSLRGVIGQRLLNRADGHGRVLAAEVLVSTPAIASHILEGQTRQLGHYQAQGAADGMQTLTQALTRLFEAGLISKEEASYHAEQPAETRPAEVGVAASSASMTEDTLMNWL